MTKTVEIDVAQATLDELVAGLGPEDEIVIIQNQKPVARITSARTPKPRFGSCRGLLTIVEDDEEHLKDFQDYMP